ncbi:MAG: hypothetical protein QHC40_11735 [Sphingobium sp.]|nr:hypothetical protein [Sphingobium sp.]
MIHVTAWLLIGASALASCTGGPENVYTLYRNSLIETTMRVHWGTFDATDSDATYNMNNCMLAARLLNANLDANAAKAEMQRDASIGFWCEPERYKEKGSVPHSFPAAFPTDV